MRITREIVIGNEVVKTIIVTDKPDTTPYTYKFIMVEGACEIFAAYTSQGNPMPEESLDSLSMLISNIANNPEYDPYIQTTLYIYVSK